MNEETGTGRAVLVVGASGGIGKAVLEHDLQAAEYEVIFAVSRGAFTFNSHPSP